MGGVLGAIASVTLSPRQGPCYTVRSSSLRFAIMNTHTCYLLLTMFTGLTIPLRTPITEIAKEKPTPLEDKEHCIDILIIPRRQTHSL